MRYLVKAQVKPGRAKDLLKAIESGRIGAGSIAGGEYLRDMNHARLLKDGTVVWIEVCFCSTPLQEEKPYWEKYFDLLQIKNAHNRKRCKDLNDSEPWACSDCDCTERLEARIKEWGSLFLTEMKSNSHPD